MEVLIKGQRCRVIETGGDFSRIDVTGIHNIGTGEEVVLIGSQGDQSVTIEEVSTHSGQSAYRTPVYLSPNVPRILL
jgi:alanine racemase